MSSAINFSPTSSLQRQFWLAQQQDEGGGSNNIAAGFILKGSLHVEAFLECLKEVVHKHAALQSQFILVAGELQQHINPAASVEICRHEIYDGKEDAAMAKLRSEAARPFDLSTGPLIRVAIISRRGQSDWTALGLIFHHIAVDFRSKEILGTELAAAYAARVSGTVVPTETSEPSYVDFCNHERTWLQSPEADKMLDAWKKSLQGKSLILPLATDFSRPATNTFRGSLIDFSFDADLSSEILCLCRDQKVDPFVALLAGYFVLFSRYSKCNNFAVGIPLTNRRMQSFASTVGCFVNILPVSISISAEDSFVDIMQKVRRELLLAHRNQELPTERIVAAVNKHRVVDRNPLYQIGFTIEPPMRLDLAGLSCEPFHCPTSGAQLDFFLRYWVDDNNIVGQLRFNDQLFESRTANKVVNEFKELLRTASRNAARPFAHVNFAANAILSCAHRSDITSTPLPPVPPLPRHQIAIAASFTAEPMQDTFEFLFERLGWSADLAFAPFNQIFQELVNPTSLLRRNTNGANLIFLRFDDLIELADKAAAQSPAARLRANLAELVTTVQTSAPAFRVPLCIFICPSSTQLSATVPEEGLLRTDFTTRLQAIPGVNILTPEIVSNWYPVADWHEAAGEELGHIPYTPRYLTALATSAVRTLNAINQKPVKALVIDCDGTLWDGVVGEEGPEGVVVGPLQKQFQEFLLTQHRAGVLLCLCSKNHEADVWAVFDRHPGMVLKRDHIAFARINWLPKSVNLQSLAAEINIGLNALAFLDDNILEREEVRAGCPSVLCPELPAAWEARVPLLQNLWPLDRLRVTGEDQKRTEHYRSESLRADLRRDAGSYADFLKHLELVVEIRPAVPADIDRLTQLTIRTNQFNSTVRRLTVAEVASHIGQPDRAAFVTHVRDRFGDYGLVGAAFAVKKNETLIVDPLLLSCRALGRGVEHRIAAALGTHAVASDCGWVDFPVKPTDRNEPARTFLQTLERLCAGTRDVTQTLRVASARLETVRFTPEANAADIAQQPITTSTTTESTTLWDSRVIQLAVTLTSADGIFEELTKWRQQRHSRPTPLTRPAGTGDSLSDTEQIIATAWKKILALSEIGTNENFFEVGGTSILAAQLALELRRQELAVTIVDLFHHPTIASLARNLTVAPLPAKSPVPARPTEQQAPNSTTSRPLPAAFDRLRRFRGK